MLKRPLDVVVSSVTLILLSPLLWIIALAIKLESEGPLLFRQSRAGRGGQPLTMYKFRKFLAACDGRGPGLAAVDDPRLSRVGRVLQRLQLDEVPQLLNVLKGDMPLGGPRPEMPNFVKLYSESAYEVLCVRPRIFGIHYLDHRGGERAHESE